LQLTSPAVEEFAAHPGGQERVNPRRRLSAFEIDFAPKNNGPARAVISFWKNLQTVSESHRGSRLKDMDAPPR